MAKLYEKQGEFTHALGVYLLLAATDKQAKKKVKELTKKLYDNPKLSYNPLIRLIFDEQQLQKIKLLPSNEYRKLSLGETEPSLDDAPQTEDAEETQTKNINQESNHEELDLELDEGISLADFKKMSQPEPAVQTQKPQTDAKPTTKPESKSKPAPQPAMPKPLKKLPAQPDCKSFEQMSLAQLLQAIGDKLDPQTKLNQITLEQLKKMLKF